MKIYFCEEGNKRRKTIGGEETYLFAEETKNREEKEKEKNCKRRGTEKENEKNI